MDNNIKIDILNCKLLIVEILIAVNNNWQKTYLKFKHGTGYNKLRILRKLNKNPFGGK